jgi:hypothetical protein
MYSIEIAKTFTELKSFSKEWQLLSRDAADQNIFYEPFMALPALEYLDPCKELNFILIFHAAGPDVSKTLCALFPFEIKRTFHRLPVKYMSSWKYKHCFLCTPLIHKEHVEASIQCLIDWIKKSGQKTFFEFRHVSAMSIFYKAFQSCLKTNPLPHLLTHRHQRAVLWNKTQHQDEYFFNILSRKRRKEYQRLENRLKDNGKLEYAVFHPQESLQKWLAEFLELEARGWKGLNKSSLNFREEERRFFTVSSEEAAQAQKLMVLSLRIDGKPIAMKWNFLSPPGSFSFKIAYDEQYHAYSPGVLLEFENIRQFFKMDHLDWMDSCALPNHPMIERLWLDRTQIMTFLITSNVRPHLLIHRVLQLVFAIKLFIEKMYNKPKFAKVKNGRNESNLS